MQSRFDEYRPGYLQLYENGKLKEIDEVLSQKLKNCTICPHECRVDRTGNKSGFCRTGFLPRVASFSPHFGEEAPLVGRRGSGTIFFSSCNLACIFCQNYEISHLDYGKEISFAELADIMISLQHAGSHNINFVSPTHVIHAIIKALLIAIPRGLKIPLVYNSGGYDSVETLKCINGVIDIYMPDLKYGDGEAARRFSGIENYSQRAAAAVREMYEQVGDLEISHEGIANKGLLIRHLVLPNDEASSNKVIDFVSNLSKGTYINIMSQYRPMFKAKRHPEIGRHASLQEIDAVKAYALRSGLRRLSS